MNVQVRYDDIGKLTEIARGSGYVMVRRPGAIPFVRSVKDWDAMSRRPFTSEPVVWFSEGHAVPAASVVSDGS